jgi:rhomboid protease GluP
MCPNCRAFITTSDKTCPYCGERTGKTYIQRNPGETALGGLIPQAHFTTILILMLNAGLFIATQLLARKFGDGRGEMIAMWALGAKSTQSIIQEHQWWRLVTAGFLHGGWIHILMNSWVLYDLGAQVEQIYETPRFLVIYFLATVGGFCMSMVMSPASLSIGASAGITGLIGAMVAFGVRNRSSLGKDIRDFYLRWVVYVLAMGFFIQGTDNWAHMGGLAAGFVVGYIAGTPIRSTHPKEAAWRAAAGVCVAITAFCFWEVYRNFPSPDQLR